MVGRGLFPGTLYNQRRDCPLDTPYAEHMTRQPPVSDPVDLVFPGTEDIDASAVFSGPGYKAPEIKTESTALTSLVLSLLFFIPALPLLGVVFGVVGLQRCANRRRNGQGLAIAGIVIGAVVTAIQLMVLYLYFSFMGAV